MAERSPKAAGCRAGFGPLAEPPGYSTLKRTAISRAPLQAAKYGLHSAFAAPVIVGDKMLGVIEFFTKRIREADTELLEMMGTIGRSGWPVHREKDRRRTNCGRSEQELADFFENATVGLHWVGPDGVILRANRAELDMLGYSREEYVGRLISEFHADEEVICDILKRLQEGEKLSEYPARLKCKDGSIKDVSDRLQRPVERRRVHSHPLLHAGCH